MPSTPTPSSSAPAHPERTAPRTWVLAIALVAAFALLAGVALPSAHAAAGHTAKTHSAKTPAVAKLTLTKVNVKGAKLTITGRVSLPPVIAKTAKTRKTKTTTQRKRSEVYLTLTGYVGTTAKTEKFTAKLNSKDTFTVTHTTTLSGALGLDVLVKIVGKQSGKKVIKTISIAASTTTSTKSTGSGSTGSGSTGGGSTGSGPTGGGSTGSGTTTTGTPLVGTFEIEAGDSLVDGAYTGSYFQMLTPGSLTPLINGESTARNPTYTLLSPGTDGGLRTTEFQPPPEPAFASDLAVQETQGRPNQEISLASRIVDPAGFFYATFGIATAPIDPQSLDLPVPPLVQGPPLSDPLPEIVDTNGVLSGQLTAWTAQWNGNSYNQGTPKPAGSPLAEYDDTTNTTTPLTGTYNAATGRYVLEWRSLIVSGGFNGFTGQWHLEGTFVPAAG